jgi:hypothetical protein
MSATVARYLTRVDTHLPALPGDAERAAFLAAEHAKWINRFETFAAKVDAGLPIDTRVSAFDFHETMAALSQRAAVIQGAV